MLIGGLIVLLFILGLFLQALTSAPRPAVELEPDVEGEFPTSPVHAETESRPVAA